MLSTFIMLLFCHALADYPLQGDFLSKAKNRLAPIPGVPWWQAMSAHVMIHSGLVFMVTGSALLATVEFIVHFLTDDAKCRGKLTFDQDQAIHVLCKLVYAGVLTYGAI